MTFSHRWKSGLNTVGATTEGYDGSAELWVESDDPQDTGLGVLKYLIAQGFTYGRRYDVGNDTDNNIILNQIDPPQLASGSAVLWQVTLHYRLATPGLLDSDGQPATIINRIPDISTSNVTRLKTIERGIYLGGLLTDWPVGVERAITNSAGVPFSPAIEVELHNRLIRISRNVAMVNMNKSAFPEKWINKENVIVSNRKTTIPILAFTMKFAGWSTEPAFEEGIDFVRVTFEGEVNDDTWRRNLLDKGLLVEACDRPDGRGGVQASYDMKPGASTKRVAKDPEGTPLTEPPMLDGKGNMVDCAEAFFYGKWKTYDEIDIRTLPFFQGFAT